MGVTKEEEPYWATSDGRGKFWIFDNFLADAFFVLKVFGSIWVVVCRNNLIPESFELFCGYVGNGASKAPEWKKLNSKDLGIRTSMIAKPTRYVLNGLKKKGIYIYIFYFPMVSQQPNRNLHRLFMDYGDIDVLRISKLNCPIAIHRFDLKLLKASDI